MKRYFVVSDLHSFYDELIEGLSKAGFNKNNKNHILVINGDIFDRGPKTVELYNYIKSFNKENLILIRGNHEDLFTDLLNKYMPDDYDFSNGTVNTFSQIAGIDFFNEYKLILKAETDQRIKTKRIFNLWNTIRNKVNKSEIAQFIRSDSFINYLEIGKFIITHGFIPTYNESVYIPTWRNILDYESWFNARWSYGPQLYKKGLFDEEAKNNKYLIVGHIHAGLCRKELEHKSEKDNSTYQFNHFVAIDTCTVITHKINVLVIENNKVIKY